MTTVASAVRPGLRDNRATSSPHTPTRFTSIGSNFSSPGSAYRQEEDAIIIELGARYLRAGFEGESGPQCVIPFDHESNRRVGDYRVYAPGYRPQPTSFEAWTKANELWQNDLDDVDLGLVEDKLERSIREVYNKYLLVDAGKARLVLILPSLLPHPLLERVLTLLFDRWGYSTISLLPSATMCLASAGLRSGLIVDIGWEEIVMTTLYEYRELRVASTLRATRMLIKNAAIALTEFARKDPELKKELPLELDFVEEIVLRLAHCKSADVANSSDVQLLEQTEKLSINEPGKSQQIQSDAALELDWPVGSVSKQITVPLSIMNDCVRNTFFDPQNERNPHDDEEQIPSEMIYRSLLALGPDLRGVCMSRIVFVGGGSQIPGLCRTILEDVQALIDRHGWTTVRGTKLTKQHQKLPTPSQGSGELLSIARHNVLQPPEDKDYVEAKLHKQWAKHAKPTQVTGVLRQVDSLGAWAGASLLTSLKIKGVVEIERDRFLSHGLAGVARDVEGGNSGLSQRISSYGVAGIKTSGQGRGLGPSA